MVFLRSSFGADDLLTLHGRGVVLRPPVAADYAAWAELRANSRDHLVPREPQWERDELTRTTFRRRLKIYAQEQRDDIGFAFFIFLHRPGRSHGTPETLAGGLRLSNIRRGVSQAATLGYWIGQPFANRGHMTAAVEAVIPFCFERLGLHRLEAACLPDNLASQRVLQRNGFDREGLARDYIKINGVWQDHVLYGAVSKQA
jgi:[ribosomal protein S5]-alanine N-acetyltransferase